MKRLGYFAAMLVLVYGGDVAASASTASATVVLNDFRFDPMTLGFHVGETVTLTVENHGRTAHEWLIGRGIVRTSEQKGFQEDLYALLRPTIEGHRYTLERVGRRPPGRDERTIRTSTGLVIEPGGTVTLHFAVPAAAAGQWAMACFFPGHYESGMQGTILIE